MGLLYKLEKIVDRRYAFWRDNNESSNCASKIWKGKTNSFKWEVNATYT